MRGRQPITTELRHSPSGSVVVSGSGDNYRLSLQQKVTHGPDQCLDRHVTLGLTPQEAIAMGVSLLLKVPGLQLLADDCAIRSLASIVRMAEVTQS